MAEIGNINLAERTKRNNKTRKGTKENQKNFKYKKPKQRRH